MSESSRPLGTKAAETELRRRIESLNEQLKEATAELAQLSISVVTTKDERTTVEFPELKTCNSAGSNSELSHSSNIVRPPGKKGYLFKWHDREVGWGGSKWALRFVVLDHGRLSYFRSHTDTDPRYVLSLRGCAARDDGWKRNRRHPIRVKGVDPPLDEPGAYFFLFSIYQRPDSAEEQDEADIMPVLRFSTPSMAERNQWIQLIADSCAYCETDEYLAEEAARDAEAEKQRKQQAEMALALPEAREGTLPPLYFAPAVKRESVNSRRSIYRTSPTSGRRKLFRTKSKNFDADAVESKSTKGYPHSKPMHRAAGPSYLSMEAPVQNYRGLFNLGIIILIVSNFRLILHHIRDDGFVLRRHIQHLLALRHGTRDPWEEFPFVSGFLLQLVFITHAFVIEWLLARKYLPEKIGMFFHHLNAHSALVVPVVIVWKFIDKPPVGAILLFHSVITWMKLVSYALANEDYRVTSEISGIEVQKTWLSLISDLDAADADTTYPQNVTLQNIFYFWLCPSLTYQIAFPKVPRVRVWKVLGILLRMVVCGSIFAFIVGQVVTPALESLVDDLRASGGRYTFAILADYWLRLAIANTYLWLLMFYFYFHLYLNLFAEILRFGDRVFYKDWWNSSEISTYWRLWNLPVHYWLVRHVYFPCIRLKMSRAGAIFVAFLFSAFMHELLVSVPFHVIRPWSFLGIMMQIPLVAWTKYLSRKFPSGFLGNVIFWLSFCVVGQPMAVLLYTVDYQYSKQDQAMNLLAQQNCSATGAGFSSIQ